MPFHPSAGAARPRGGGGRLVAAALLGAALLLCTGASGRQEPRPLPEFANRSPQAWLNTEPLSKADLAGKVVLIEVWSVS
jgi:hypothetical protein